MLSFTNYFKTYIVILDHYFIESLFSFSFCYRMLFFVLSSAVSGGAVLGGRG